MKLCEWVCDDEKVGAAQFRERGSGGARDSEFYAVVARSAKRPGLWQWTWFDNRGAGGDSEGKTCAEAINRGTDRSRRWRLEHVMDRQGVQLMGSQPRKRRAKR